MVVYINNSRSAQTYDIVVFSERMKYFSVSIKIHNAKSTCQFTWECNKNRHDKEWVEASGRMGIKKQEQTRRRGKVVLKRDWKYIICITNMRFVTEPTDNNDANWKTTFRCQDVCFAKDYLSLLACLLLYIFARKTKTKCLKQPFQQNGMVTDMESSKYDCLSFYYFNVFLQFILNSSAPFFCQSHRQMLGFKYSGNCFPLIFPILHPWMCVKNKKEIWSYLIFPTRQSLNTSNYEECESEHENAEFVHKVSSYNVNDKVHLCMKFGGCGECMYEYAMKKCASRLLTKIHFKRIGVRWLGVNMLELLLMYFSRLLMR